MFDRLTPLTQPWQLVQLVAPHGMEAISFSRHRDAPPIATAADARLAPWRDQCLQLYCWWLLHVGGCWLVPVVVSWWLLLAITVPNCYVTKQMA